MLAGIASGGCAEDGRVAEAARPYVADVGREAAAELVAQAQAEAGITQALADVVLVVVAAVEVGLKLRLQDQPVGQQYLVFAFEPGGQASGGADVASGLDLELVGRQSLHADRGPVAVAAGGIRVVAQAARAIPPRPGGMAPEPFGTGVRKAAVAAFALAAQPELVAVAADAGQQVPAQGIVLTALELVAAGTGPQPVDLHLSPPVPC